MMMMMMMIMMMKDHHVIVIMVKRSIIRRVRGEEGVEVGVGVGVIAVAAVVVEVVTRVLVEAAADLDMTRRRIEKEDTRVAVARIVSITAVITRRERRDITRIAREMGIAKRGKRRTESMIGDIMTMMSMTILIITVIIIIMMITRRHHTALHPFLTMNVKYCKNTRPNNQTHYQHSVEEEEEEEGQHLASMVLSTHPTLTLPKLNHPSNVGLPKLRGYPPLMDRSMS
jgi:hypothetical protein